MSEKKKDRNLSISHEKPYCLPECGTAPLAYPPVIIGTGPAGLFCGLMLARKGYCPILLERGEDVDARTRRVEAFWKDGVLIQHPMYSLVKAEQALFQMES